MQNLIVLAVLAAILGSAILYVRKEKKKGVKCIGCPYAESCSGSCAGCSGGCHAEK